MCGIIGIVGTAPVEARLIVSLKRLEYRGYDSAGVAGFTASGVERRRAAGKLKNLEAVLAAQPLITPDYVSVADLATLEELDRVGVGALASLAVRLGSTRLIDNLQLGVI